VRWWEHSEREGGPHLSGDHPVASWIFNSLKYICTIRQINIRRTEGFMRPLVRITLPDKKSEDVRKKL
jgi:hypothetical protein